MEYHGTSQSGSPIVEQCYNKGEVDVKEGTNYAFSGGIVGNNASVINNCYNVGKISGVGSGYARVGAIAGNAGTINYCYYLDESVSSGLGYGTTSSTITECVLKNKQEMKQRGLIDLLNSNIEQIEWKEDLKQINEGYPILSWQ